MGLSPTHTEVDFSTNLCNNGWTSSLPLFTYVQNLTNSTGQIYLTPTPNIQNEKSFAFPWMMSLHVSDSEQFLRAEILNS